MAQMKKPGMNKPDVRTTPSTGAKKLMPKVGTKPGAKIPKPQAPTGPKKPMPKIGPKPTRTVTPKPKTTKKPEKMTPQDAAMKKILEGKYGKIYG
jgi:hypothetical protein